jgi:hypothetical protein
MAIISISDSEAHSWALNFLNSIKIQRIMKQFIFIAFFKSVSSIKNYIVWNESVCVYMKYHSNHSLFTHLIVHSLTVILIFTNFSCFFFEIHYRTEAIVCQNILKTTVQCPAVILS